MTSPDFTSARALQENIVRWVVQQHPDAAVHSFASMAQASLALDDGRAGFFAAGEDIGTFLADYQRRDYPRWVVVPQLLNDQGTLVGATSMQCRSEATKWQTLHQPALWVWVPGEGMNRILHETELTHEVLAIIPLKRSSDGKQWEADKAAARWIRGW